MRKFLVLYVFAALAGCGVERDSRLTIWIPEDPRMPAEVLMDGCRHWQPFGMTCERARYVGDADISVSFLAEPCGAVLGDAHTGIDGYSDIRMWVSCFHDKEGKLLAHHMEMTFTHEVGHALGVQHVPSSCDPEVYVNERDYVDSDLKLVRHPNGRLVCGTAVMAPSLSSDVLTGPTDIDAMAFDLRDREKAIIKAGEPSVYHPDPAPAGRSP